MLEILDGEFLHECAHVRFNTRSLRMFSKDRPGRKFGRPPEQMPMPKIDLFDDDACRRLYPFHLVEAVEGIRHGAFTQRERWDQVERELSDKGWTGELKVNSRWIPDTDTAADLISAGPQRMEHQGTLLTLGPVPSNDDAPSISAPRAPRMLDHANDLFSGLEDQLTRDLDAMRSNWTLHPAGVEPPTQLYGPADQVLVAETAPECTRFAALIRGR